MIDAKLKQGTNPWVIAYKSGTVRVGSDLLSVLWKLVPVSSSGDNTAVPAIAGRKIRVLSLVGDSPAALNVIWKSGANTTLIPTTLWKTAQNVNYNCSYFGWIMETNPGEALVVNVDFAGTALAFTVGYVIV